MDEELLREFIIESYESLDSLDSDLLALEKDPSNKDIINSVFRKIHTIKGTCGFLDLGNMERLAHTGETLLDSVRADKLNMSDEIISGSLKMLDAIRAMLSELEVSGTDSGVETKEIIAELHALHDIKVNTEEPCQSEEENLQETEETVAAQDSDELEDLFASAKQAYEQEVQHEAEEVRVEKQDAKEETKNVSGNSKLADTSLRVDVGLVDRLMNLVGELVLTRNQLLQFAAESTDSAFTNVSQQLNLITSELQEGLMRTRLQPISNIWNKFPRIVRDIAKQCDKDVRILMEGEETELDKTIIEAIKDPLTHIIRNSVDHGIETPSVRKDKQKPEQGTITLKAAHEGGNVLIEIRDDGQGVNTERVREKALEKNLFTEVELSQMSDTEVQNLIFHPGFSTAEKVSNLSGRGVGMDVVRSNLERIGGHVELHSVYGSGTTLRIKIPLTLAIIPALVISQSEQRYAIPQVDLVELFRLDAEQQRTSIEYIDKAAFIRLRDELLPIVFLKDELQGGSVVNTVHSNEELTVVVIKIGEQQYGLVVDDVHDTQEIVVKPLDDRLKHIPIFAGATIMGDGKLALILDTDGLAHSANVICSQSKERNEGNTEEKLETTRLIIATLNEQRIALELEKVHRLEEFEGSELSIGSGQLVVKYRDGLLPLRSMSKALDHEYKLKHDETLNVIVLQSADTYYGIIVDSIEDIIDEVLELHSWESSPIEGIRGSAILQDKVTDLLDVDYFIGGPHVS